MLKQSVEKSRRAKSEKCLRQAEAHGRLSVHFMPLMREAFFFGIKLPMQLVKTICVRLNGLVTLNKPKKGTPRPG